MTADPNDRHHIHIRIPGPLWRRFKPIADQEAPSANAAINTAIAEYVRRREKPEEGE